MTEFSAINTALSEDHELMRLWDNTVFEWQRTTSNFVRRRRTLRSKVFRKAYDIVKDGEHGPQNVADQLCESFITTLIITEVIKMLFYAIAKAIIRRWG